MNILEALKSGKSVRRGNSGDFVPAYLAPYTVTDILAEDWEVEEEKVEITKQQVEEASSACFEVGCYKWRIY